jgi:DNA repair exonuclease SbcCD ATPase subunit
LRQAWNEAHRNAIKLEALLERADELEKDQIQARLDNAVLKRDMIYRDYKAVENDLRRAQNALRQAYGNKTNLEQHLDAERASQEQAREQTARFNEEFPKEIDSYIERFSKDYNVPDAQKEYLWAVVNRDLMFDLYHLQGTPVQEIDFAQMTRDKVEMHVKMLGLAKKQAFTNASQQKIAARPPSASNGSPRSPRQTSPSDVTDEMMNRPALARKAFVGR